MAEIRLEHDGPVAVLTLDAPDRRNALTAAMARELQDACERIDADPGVGAVVVRGSGGSFCAGAHRDLLAAAAEDPAEDARLKEVQSVYGSFARVGRLEPPTVAAIEGAAVGAGVNLAFATDLRVMAEDARLLAGFLRIGLHPGGGHFTLVGRTAGREVAAGLGLFGEELDGRRARELGVAWAAVPAGEVGDTALRLAHQAGRDPELARAAARNLRLELGPPGVPWPVALEAETATQLWSLRRRGPG
jgi:enoyl-CoA hydratase